MKRVKRIIILDTFCICCWVFPQEKIIYERVVYVDEVCESREDEDIINFEVIFPDAIIDPRTMVVHLVDTAATYEAMLWPLRLHDLTFKADFIYFIVSQYPGIFIPFQRFKDILKYDFLTVGLALSVQVHNAGSVICLITRIHKS